MLKTVDKEMLKKIIKNFYDLKKLIIIFITFYRYGGIKGYWNFSGSCLFDLSCSRFAYKQLKSKKLFPAIFLTLKRFYYCTPKRYKKFNLNIKEEK